MRSLLPLAAAVAAAAGAMLVARSDPPARIVTQHSALAALIGTSARPGSLADQLEYLWRADAHSPAAASMARLIDERVPAGTPLALLAASQDAPEAVLKSSASTRCRSRARRRTSSPPRPCGASPAWR